MSGMSDRWKKYLSELDRADACLAACEGIDSPQPGAYKALLEACKAMVSELSEDFDGMEPLCMRSARAAIAKAEG